MFSFSYINQLLCQNGCGRKKMRKLYRKPNASLRKPTTHSEGWKLVSKTRESRGTWCTHCATEYYFTVLFLFSFFSSLSPEILRTIRIYKIPYEYHCHLSIMHHLFTCSQHIAEQAEKLKSEVNKKMHLLEKELKVGFMLILEKC